MSRTARLRCATGVRDPAAVPPFEFGVVTASYSGGGEFGQCEVERLRRSGPDHVGPYQSIAWCYAAGVGQISIRNGLRGPSGVLVADGAGGVDAIADASAGAGGWRPPAAPTPPVPSCRTAPPRIRSRIPTTRPSRS
ncbi:hypothetical protein AB0I91_39950 [Actinosynnema sp. NPDC049800]